MKPALVAQGSLQRGVTPITLGVYPVQLAVVQGGVGGGRGGCARTPERATACFPGCRPRARPNPNLPRKGRARHPSRPLCGFRLRVLPGVRHAPNARVRATAPHNELRLVRGTETSPARDSAIVFWVAGFWFRKKDNAEDSAQCSPHRPRRGSRPAYRTHTSTSCHACRAISPSSPRRACGTATSTSFGPGSPVRMDSRSDRT
mmetsp:Transcript_9427/g.35110  ORF Transcript_9427/g.35110 Transcript_9427/m.35110 type:complete len:203 (+) Transcript_9427:1118-1726(+)